MGHYDSCYEYDRLHGRYMEERVKQIREELKDAPTKIVKVKLEMLDKYEWKEIKMVKPTKTKQQMVDEIMDWFDFDRVHKVMVALDWHWASADDGIPSKGELRKVARELLWRVLENKDEYKIATGGFQASYENEVLSLKFIVSDWEVDLEDE